MAVVEPKFIRLQDALLRLAGEQPSNARNAGLDQALDRAAAKLARRMALYVQHGRYRMRTVRPHWGAERQSGRARMEEGSLAA